MKSQEKNLLDLLDIVILMQMLVEKVESFQIENHYNKQLIKQQLKAVLKTITPLAERDYGIVFSNGETETIEATTHRILKKYENLQR